MQRPFSGPTGEDSFDQKRRPDCMGSCRCTPARFGETNRSHVFNGSRVCKSWYIDPANVYYQVSFMVHASLEYERLEEFVQCSKGHIQIHLCSVAEKATHRATRQNCLCLVTLGHDKTYTMTVLGSCAHGEIRLQVTSQRRENNMPKQRAGIKSPISQEVNNSFAKTNCLTRASKRR